MGWGLWGPYMGTLPWSDGLGTLGPVYGGKTVGKLSANAARRPREKFTNQFTSAQNPPKPKKPPKKFQKISI